MRCGAGRKIVYWPDFGTESAFRDPHLLAGEQGVAIAFGDKVGLPKLAIDRDIDSSENRRAAVDRNDLPGGRCGFVRGEIQCHVSDVYGLAPAEQVQPCPRVVP